MVGVAPSAALLLLHQILSSLSRKSVLQIDDFKADDLNFVGQMRVRTAVELAKGFVAIKEARSGFTMPVYAHHGTADIITSPAVSHALPRHLLGSGWLMQLYNAAGLGGLRAGSALHRQDLHQGPGGPARAAHGLTEQQVRGAHLGVDTRQESPAQAVV